MPSRSKKLALATRRGAASRAAIPAQALRELHAGRIESRSLVEWLALDLATALLAAWPAARARARPAVLWVRETGERWTRESTVAETGVHREESATQRGRVM